MIGEEVRRKAGFNSGTAQFNHTSIIAHTHSRCKQVKLPTALARLHKHFSVYLPNWSHYDRTMAGKNESFDMMTLFVQAVHREEHWVVEMGAPRVKDPNDYRGPSHSMINAMYATYVDRIPPGKSAKSTCGVRDCVRPHHLKLVDTCRKGGAIDFSETAKLYKRLCKFWVDVDVEVDC